MCCVADVAHTAAQSTSLHMIYLMLLRELWPDSLELGPGGGGLMMLRPGGGGLMMLGPDDVGT